MSHFLINNAYRYSLTHETSPETFCSYSKSKGYWVNNKTGEPMVASSCDIGPASKKADVETGEDMKGE